MPVSDSGPLPHFLHGPYIHLFDVLIRHLASRALKVIEVCPSNARMDTISVPCSSELMAKVGRTVWHLATVPAALA